MKISERPSLKALNTFGIDASASLRIDIESEEDILALPAFNQDTDLLLGGGSNVLLVGNVPGTVFLNRIRGRQVVKKRTGHSVIEAGAGENWHELVKWTLQHGYSGIENLALIPGSVGAAPIQNIGAYGVELASVLESVTAWDWRLQNWKVFRREECRFAYRDSLFKTEQPGRYLITSVRLVLDHKFHPQLAYRELASTFEGHNTTHLTPQQVFEAVVNIRQRKLPDPAEAGNAGSFFKNPVIDGETARALSEKYPQLPVWPAAGDMKKVSAAWMIEHCGLKGHRQGQAGVSDQHALVLVNHGNSDGQSVWSLAQKIQSRVADEFGVALEPEPQIVNFN